MLLDSTAAQIKNCSGWCRIFKVKICRRFPAVPCNHHHPGPVTLSSPTLIFFPKQRLESSGSQNTPFAVPLASLGPNPQTFQALNKLCAEASCLISFCVGLLNIGRIQTRGTQNSQILGTQMTIILGMSTMPITNFEFHKTTFTRITHRFAAQSMVHQPPMEQ